MNSDQIRPRLVIVIPTLNRFNFLLPLLRQLSLQVIKLSLDYGYPVVKIVCIDNASTDETRLLEQHIDPSIINVIHRQERLASNESLANAFFHTLESDFTWTLSDDEILLEDSVLRALDSCDVADKIGANTLLFNFYQYDPKTSTTYSITALPLPHTKFSVFSNVSSLLCQTGVAGLLGFISSWCVRTDVLRGGPVL